MGTAGTISTLPWKTNQQLSCLTMASFIHIFIPFLCPNVLLPSVFVLLSFFHPSYHFIHILILLSPPYLILFPYICILSLSFKTLTNIFLNVSFINHSHLHQLISFPQQVIWSQFNSSIPSFCFHFIIFPFTSHSLSAWSLSCSFSAQSFQTMKPDSIVFYGGPFHYRTDNKWLFGSSNTQM